MKKYGGINIKKTIHNKTKTMMLVICILMLLTSFSSVVVSDRYSENTDIMVHNAALEIMDVEAFGNICTNYVINHADLQTPFFNQNMMFIPSSVNVSYPSDLSDPNNTADYLIITSDYFYNPAKQDFENGTLDNILNELAHWRAEYNRFDVSVVNVSNSFIGGNNDTKIKIFIEYVYDHWSAPRMSGNHVEYILLVGDTQHVAAHLLDYEHFGDPGYFACDKWYGCIYDDCLNAIPDIKIGRFSVDNQTELDVIANKTIQYEQNPEHGDWRKEVLMVRGEFGDTVWYNSVKKNLLELGGWNVSEVFKAEGGVLYNMCLANLYWQFCIGKFLYHRGWFTNCHPHELSSYVFTDYETFDGGGK